MVQNKVKPFQRELRCKSTIKQKQMDKKRCMIKNKTDGINVWMTVDE